MERVKIVTLMFETVFIFLMKCLWGLIYIGFYIGAVVLTVYFAMYIWQALRGKIDPPNRLFW